LIIYPAIDIKDGKCVRLFQGDFSQTTVYSDDPVEVALKWEYKGAEYIHIVDLDGALAGSPQNLPVIKNIISKLKIPIQVGGGIRTLETGNKILEAGAARIIMGTSAVKTPEILEQAVNQFGDRLAVGVDAKNKKVAVEGWGETSEILALNFIQRMENIGVKTIIYTDISKDGTLQGPDINGIREIISNTGINIIASGGVGTLQDLINLKELGSSGAIVGKALYTDSLTLEEALEI